MTPEDIKKHIDLADYVRSCGIELIGNGTELKARCPFSDHEDKTPSFCINTRKQLFNCFGCDRKGSIIDFVKDYENLTTAETLQKLSDLVSKANGKKLSTPRPPCRAITGGDGGSSSALPAERANKLLERVVQLYEKTFADVPEGREYLESRGITDAGLFGQHRIGYCNGTLTSILPSPEGRSRDFGSNTHKELKELGILLASGHERFIGCVVVPVFDSDGNITTLYARHTAPERKQHMFLPNRSKGLWNITAVKTYPEIILVESIIDGLSLQMAGHHNVVAIQGSALQTNNGQADLLQENGVQTITFLLDGDEAGQKAMTQLSKKLNGHFSQKSITIPDAHDPNSYLVEHGAEKLATLVVGVDASEVTSPATRPSNPIPQTEPLSNGFSVCYGLRRYEIHGLEKGPRKLKATIRIELAGKLHVDTLDFYSSRARRSLAQDICRIFEQSAETIEADVNKLLLACENHDPEQVTKNTPDPANEMSARDRKEAGTFGKSPDLIKNILADYEKCGLVGEKHNKLLCYLAAVSRKMDKPLSVLTLSSSGAGKTALQDATLAFCPPEDVVKLTSLSGKALFYKDQLSLKHKILALEEGDGAEDASYAIRNLISAGVLIIESTVKDLQSGRLTTMENRVEGPTSVFVTTTDPNTDSETKSRFWVTSIDECRGQTREILSFQRQRHSFNGLSGNTKEGPILRKHQNFQRLLRPLAVVNPYADYLGYSDDRLQSRRDQPKYLNLIATVAFLRQMTKPVKTLKHADKTVFYIEVDLDDIRVANELTNQILGKSLDELSAPARELLVLLDDLVEKRFGELQKDEGENVPPRTRISFTRRDVRDFSGWANTRLHAYLKELIDMEYVTIESGRSNSLQHYRLLYEGQGKDGGKFIPGLKSVDEIAKAYGQDQSNR